MTPRLDVLKHHLNPNLADLDQGLIARYIGDTTKTSIERNQYLSVKSKKYFIPSVDVLGSLLPNNYTVQAYYIPNTDKTIDSVFIYQNEEFIAECQPIETYNTAKAEWTDKDKEAYDFQADYVKDFREKQKARKEKVYKLKKLPKEVVEKAETTKEEIVKPPKSDEVDIDALLASYDVKQFSKQGVNSL